MKCLYLTIGNPYYSVKVTGVNNEGEYIVKIHERTHSGQVNARPLACPVNNNYYTNDLQDAINTANAIGASLPK